MPPDVADAAKLVCGPSVSSSTPRSPGTAIKIASMFDEHARVSLLADVAVTKAKKRGAFRSDARLDSSTFTTD